MKYFVKYIVSCHVSNINFNNVNMYNMKSRIKEFNKHASDTTSCIISCTIMYIMMTNDFEYHKK